MSNRKHMPASPSDNRLHGISIECTNTVQKRLSTMQNKSAARHRALW
jgi:hypothetical protein